MVLSKQVEAMRKLGMTDAEIADVLEADKRIDKGEKLFELDPELEKGAKKARQADRKPTVYDFSKRERKADNDKSTLVSALFNAILPICESYEVQNAEREFTFVYNGRKFKVVLSAPRS